MMIKMCEALVIHSNSNRVSAKEQGEDSVVMLPCADIRMLFAKTLSEFTSARHGNRIRKSRLGHEVHIHNFLFLHRVSAFRFTGSK